MQRLGNHLTIFYQCYIIRGCNIDVLKKWHIYVDKITMNVTKQWVSYIHS